MVIAGGDVRFKWRLAVSLASTNLVGERTREVASEPPLGLVSVINHFRHVETRSGISRRRHWTVILGLENKRDWRDAASKGLSSARGKCAVF